MMSLFNHHIITIMNRQKILYIFCCLLLSTSHLIKAQEVVESSMLTIDRIFNSGEFRRDFQRPIQWIENGAAYVTIESSSTEAGGDELIRYDSKTQNRKNYYQQYEQPYLYPMIYIIFIEANFIFHTYCSLIFNNFFCLPIIATLKFITDHTF